MQEAVNLPEFSYEGSNPSRRTNTKKSIPLGVPFLFVRREKVPQRHLRQDSKRLPSIFGENGDNLYCLCKKTFFLRSLKK